MSHECAALPTKVPCTPQDILSPHLSTQNKWDHYPQFATCARIMCLRIILLPVSRLAVTTDFDDHSNVFHGHRPERKEMSKVVCAQTGIIPKTRLVERGMFPGEADPVT